MTEERNEAQRLKGFFAAPLNQTTRERIFFDRLSFDLKIAAARLEYHLHIYEPDVDRDGFDFIVEDQDLNRRWLQMKSRLDDGATSWDILVDLLRPEASVRLPCETANRKPPEDAASMPYDFAYAAAGRGGGVVLIEIDSSTPYGEVTYSYTDIHIIAAISQRFLIERPWAGPGRRSCATEKAEKIMEQLRELEPAGTVALAKSMFIRLARPDDLLTLMALRTRKAAFATYTIKDAWSSSAIGNSGATDSNAPEVAALYYHLHRLTALQTKHTEKKEALYDPFTWIGHAPPVP